MDVTGCLLWIVAIATIWIWGPLWLLYKYWLQALGIAIGWVIRIMLLPGPEPAPPPPVAKPAPPTPEPTLEQLARQEEATWREERKAAIRKRYADLAEVEVKRFEKEWGG